MTVTPADLATYLGATLDDARAQYVIDRATELCMSVVNPLPAGSDAVVLDVASRAYANPTSVHQQTAGAYSAAFGPMGGGLWLTRANKTILRKLAGGSSAYSIDTMPTGVNCVQTLTVSATAGTYTLSFNGQTSVALAYNASAQTVQSALDALAGSGNTQVTGGNPYVITFVNNLATTPLPPITTDAALLTGTATVAVTTQGVRAPGQGLAYWDFDYYNSGGSALPIG